MKKFIKIIADVLLGFAAILGLIQFLPIKIEKLDLLIISVGLLFLIFIILIINHISKLEKRIENIKNKFIRADELIDMKKDIEAFKLLKLIKK